MQESNFRLVRIVGSLPVCDEIITFFYKQTYITDVHITFTVLHYLSETG